MPIYALSWSQAQTGETTCIAATGVEGLDEAPGYAAPGPFNSWGPDHVYIIDLDKEIFTVDGFSQYRLSRLPDYLDDRLSHGRMYNHIPRKIKPKPTMQYEHLKPSVVRPNLHPPLTRSLLSLSTRKFSR
jgi:hypothetical protein